MSHSFYPVQQVACERCGTTYHVVKLELMNPEPRPKWFSGGSSWLSSCEACLLEIGALSKEEINHHKSRRFDMAEFLGAEAG